ncbi:type II toxin-antitoxin system death-on-curing family toxin [Pelagovum pacificum]|uniref:Type II toxin-antitoxin system death-on-curing family toxin n=1 Tax=Pelagovum pacificum TaxID=2588711 RepID=A0A5C5GGF3_9RHOB|nr:type II toxin-antitoxin system death-on-curing family toxin [Pelagovum pacificum]QQA43580.1 type II toxin-antitoxin system death-on-curing family toxin [Pelagovum pacificum]TNY33284.1 type II toxin-antitoxin system death-on-curing family toxin [Pelagovum pacificum]
MTGPVWVPIAAVIAIHDRQISRHGGASGMRDRSLLEMGCARAMNRAGYEDARLEDIAAAYAFGLAKAHAFVDGNKRTAFVTAVTFLRLNGYAFRPDPIQGVRMMEDLASSEVGEADFANWLAAGMVALPEG